MPDLSAKKLKTAQGLVNKDPAFRKLGNIDLKMAIKTGKSIYLIIFKAFSCDSITRISSNELRDADFVIEMSPAMWDRFIAGRQAGNGPTIAQLDYTDKVVKANARDTLNFLRYHTSLQAFFDAYASLEETPA